jgi:glycolate oxidase FAD binding subunit
MDTQAGTAPDRSLQEVTAIVGAEHARQAAAHDGRTGPRARIVVEPGTVDEVSEVMALAYHERWRVCARGSGSKIDWGTQTRDCDIVVCTTRLNRVLEHAADDLIVRTEAGITLDVLQSALATSGQMLALNPPSPGGTIGGILATNASGYRRQRYGTARDVIIGITVVLADGTIAKAGGKVVKNVAGYDLSKLFTGSLGTLGTIVEAAFRLHPRAAYRRTVTLPVRSAADAAGALETLKSSRIPLVFDALELQWTSSGGRLVALFEGTLPGVVAQANEALALLTPCGHVQIATGEEEEATWSALDRWPWQGHLAGDYQVGLKIAVAPGEVGATLQELVRLLDAHAPSHEVICHAGVGVFLLGAAAGTPMPLIALIGALREVIVRQGGSVVVLSASGEVVDAVDSWGPVAGALPLMQRVKDQFDPLGLLNPGCFVGGI